MLTNSPIEPFIFEGVKFWLKRDDLLDDELDGNKARKFYSLFNSDLDDIDTIVSFGGAQSNAMYSLSALAKKKQKKFVYYTKKLPKTLAQNINGNLKYALQNGMTLIECNDDEYAKISTKQDIKAKNELFVPQGGAFSPARKGVWILAEELNEFCAQNKIKKPTVIVSCGTGTTAAYLAEKFHGEVVCVPCVGDEKYLSEQIKNLTDPKTSLTFIDTNQKIPFAKPMIEVLETYHKLLSNGVEFDLLYDSKSWLAVKENITLFEGCEAIFVHSGGVRGNQTQLERYKYKKLAL